MQRICSKIISLYKHLQRRPNNSIGCLEDEETKLRGKGEIKATDVLQEAIHIIVTQCRPDYFDQFCPFKRVIV